LEEHRCSYADEFQIRSCLFAINTKVTKPFCDGLICLTSILQCPQHHLEMATCHCGVAHLRCGWLPTSFVHPFQNLKMTSSCSCLKPKLFIKSASRPILPHPLQGLKVSICRCTFQSSKNNLSPSSTSGFEDILLQLQLGILSDSMALHFYATSATP